MGTRITEKQKLYFLLVMALVAGIIAYFRFFQPKEASGTPSAVESPEHRKPVPVSMLGKPEPAHHRSSPADTDVSRSIARNIFEPAAPLPAIQEKSTTTAPKHREEMRLTGTIIGGDLSMAIINNTFVRQGQTIGPYKVTRITPDKVFLASDGGQLCLEVISAPEAISE